jgi:hypothetical protein
MPKKTTPAPASAPAAAKNASKPPAKATKPTTGPTSTPVRNTAIPKAPPAMPRGFGAAAATPRREITHEMIARRAYEISQSPEGRSPEENWFRAERELRNGR